MPDALGFLVLDGCMVLNDLWTYENLACRLGEVGIRKFDPPCEALSIDVCGPWTPDPDRTFWSDYDAPIPYDYPIPYNGGVNRQEAVVTDYDAPIDYDSPIPYDGGWSQIDFDGEPPWHDTSVEASEDFLGFWVEKFDFPAVVQRTTYPRGGPLGGSTIGRLQRPQREMAVEVLAVATSDAGLRYGFDWLTTKLAGCGDCSDVSGLVRLHCTDQDHPTLGMWELRRIALLDPPSDEGSVFNFNGCLIRKATFTIAAGDPYRYKCPYDLVTDETFEVVNGSGGEDCLTMVDWLCPDDPADYRICAEVPAPGAITTTDINVVIAAGSEGMAPLRIKGALNPLSLECADPRLEPCMEMTVAGLGPAERLFIDSSNRRVWFSSPATANEWVDGIDHVIVQSDRSPEFLSIDGCDPAWVWITPAAFCNLSDETKITVTAVDKVAA